MRTAKALGYRGLGELRRALAAGSTNPPLADRLRRTLDHAPADELLATAVSDHVAALDALTRNVTPAPSTAPSTSSPPADRIVWRGVGPSAYLAGYGALLAERIGASSRALVHVGTSFADELLTLAPGDAVVVLAYGRPQVDVPRAARTRPRSRAARRLDHRHVGPPLRRRRRGRAHLRARASWAVRQPRRDAGVDRSARARRRRRRPTAAETSLTTLNQLRAELAGRRIDVDVS